VDAGGDRPSLRADRDQRSGEGRQRASSAASAGSRAESGAICLHLADLHPEAGLSAPLGSTDRAHVYQWAFFALSELEGGVFGWMRARRAGEDEVAHTERFTPLGALVTQTLADRSWLLGERFTVADVLCASVLGGLFRHGLGEQPDALRAYVERAQERPAYQRAEAVGR
jgi:glutathione S-transferase